MGRQPRKYPVGKYVIEFKGKKNDPSARHTISLQYSWGGQIVRRSSGVRCLEKDWNPKTGELRASYRNDYRRENERLRQDKEKYDNRIKDFVANNDNHLIKQDLRDLLDDKLISRADKGLDFIEFAKEKLESEYKRNKIGHSRYKNGLSSFSMFTEFLVSTANGTYKPDGIYLSEISPDLIG